MSYLYIHHYVPVCQMGNRLLSMEGLTILVLELTVPLENIPEEACGAEH